jgi:hypothetical protein
VAAPAFRRRLGDLLPIGSKRRGFLYMRNRSDIWISFRIELFGHLQTAALFLGWVSAVLILMVRVLWTSVPEPKFAVHPGVASEDWVMTSTSTSPLWAMPRSASVATPLIKDNPMIVLANNNLAP